MKTCTQCGKTNPDDAGYCYQCGNNIRSAAVMAKRSFWYRLPSWAWIFIGLAAIAVFIGVTERVRSVFQGNVCLGALCR